MENNQLPKLNKNALRIGYYSDKYFLRTQEILIKDNYQNSVHYQYFPRKDCVVCGIPHVIDILKKCIGYYKNREIAWSDFKDFQSFNFYDDEINIDSQYEFNCCLNSLEDNWIDKSEEVKIYAIEEGSNVKNMEPVIGLIGNPKYFAHLETPTLGILAQQSAVATSVRQITKRLKPNQDLLFFPARFRHYVNQAADGYSAVVGGVKFLSTDSNGEYWGYNGIGTIPHLLIAAYGGNTSLAALKFDEYIDPSINRTILVDWDNDCINTSIEVLKTFAKNQKTDIKNVVGEGKGKIYGVRFDTSGSLVDKSLYKRTIDSFYNSSSVFGVCPDLVFEARKKFDSLGLNELKIIVSGGFDIEKIDLFQSLNVPVDMFGIGSSIVNKFTVDFTADAVCLNGNHNAKVGRGLLDWSKLKLVEF